MADLDAPDRLAAFDDVILEREDDETLLGLVRGAAMATGTPIGLISLVMGKVQWFRAQTGLPQDLMLSRATSRCDSFCQFVVRDEAMVEIPDATAQPALPQQLVQQYGVKAYLGAPVRYRGQVVGSLCVVDVVARSFTPHHRRVVEDAARDATARLAELARMRREAPAPYATLAEVVERMGTLERAMVEVGALARIGKDVERLDDQALRRALLVLAELAEFQPTLVGLAHDLRLSLEAIASRTAALPNA